MRSRAFRPLGLPIYVARVPAAPFSLLPSSLRLDHSHCRVLAPATLAALPSTRAIPDRDVFYVVDSRYSQSLGCVTTRPIQSIRRFPNMAYSSHSLHSGDVMANEQTSLSRVADCGELPLLLDKSSRHDRRYRSEPRALQPYITFDGHRPRYESEFFTASLRPDRH